MKIATNYIHAEQYLNEYKSELTAKYGKGFKGSQLTDKEIDLLQAYKEKLQNNSISINNYVSRA